MGTLYLRRGRWFIGFKTPKGWRYRDTGYAPEQRAKAERALALVEADLAQGDNRVGAARKTVAQYAAAWHSSRVERGLTNATKDAARFDAYVLPELGRFRLVEVRPLHVRELVAKLRASGRAPRTVLSTYGLVRRFFADAVADELLSVSPCALKRGDLPRKADADPRWRARAVFSRAEAAELVSDPRVPLDRRVVYGLGLLAGLREGEIAALRWSAYDASREPLGCLYVDTSYTRANKREKATKTDRPRQVPVHPVLAALLARWRDIGFAEAFGRAPLAEDLLVPSRHGSYRTDNSFLKGLKADLDVLGLTHRRFHDTRRTFISLARTDGANRDVLRTVTHDQAGDVFDQYTSFTWAAVCEAVSVLRVEARPAESLAVASGAYFQFTSKEGEPMQTMRTTSEKVWAGGDSKSPGNSAGAGQVVAISGPGRGSAGRRGAAGFVSGSKPTSTRVLAELREAAEVFERTGNDRALAARLRVVLAQLRGGAR